MVSMTSARNFLNSCVLCEEEPLFNEVFMKNNGNDVDFVEGWSPTNVTFLMLQESCGGLASAFPNNATVESDFVIIGWEKNDSRTDLTDYTRSNSMTSKYFRASALRIRQISLILL
jgi:hypothetical protein